LLGITSGCRIPVLGEYSECDPLSASVICGNPLYP
jgi:hypothetical protein